MGSAGDGTSEADLVAGGFVRGGRNTRSSNRTCGFPASYVARHIMHPAFRPASSQAHKAAAHSGPRRRDTPNGPYTHPPVRPQLRIASRDPRDPMRRPARMSAQLLVFPIGRLVGNGGAEVDEVLPEPILRSPRPKRVAQKIGQMDSPSSPSRAADR